MIKIKSTLCMLCVFLVTTAHGQASHTDGSTAFRVEGLVHRELVLKSGNQTTIAKHDREGIRIISYGLKIKKQFSATGILWTDVLDSAGILVPAHTRKGRFRIVLDAPDGYQVAFSEPELFNTSLGDQVYLLCETRPAEASRGRGGPWISVPLTDSLTGLLCKMAALYC